MNTSIPVQVNPLHCFVVPSRTTSTELCMCCEWTAKVVLTQRPLLLFPEDKVWIQVTCTTRPKTTNYGTQKQIKKKILQSFHTIQSNMLYGYNSQVENRLGSFKKLKMRQTDRNTLQGLKCHWYLHSNVILTAHCFAYSYSYFLSTAAITQYTTISASFLYSSDQTWLKFAI